MLDSSPGKTSDFHILWHSEALHSKVDQFTEVLFYSCGTSRLLYFFLHFISCRIFLKLIDLLTFAQHFVNFRIKTRGGQLRRNCRRDYLFQFGIGWGERLR